jgi:hypothetical protein
MEEEKVTYTKKDIINVLRDLNMIVVSLDRIGSEYSEHLGRKSDEELNSLLADFIFEWKVDGKLASARKILGEAFSYELADDDMGEEERFCKDLQYWSLKNPSPNNK